ncbi:hypothetical protein [Microbacterium sp. SY138]|uniref:hypothetical protein n=1 Tax=Microbacterium sp. SY138 TaxID=3149040 RepID=UPI003219086C
MPIDPRTPVGDYDRIAIEFKALKDRLSELESPTGTQVFRTVAKLEALVNDIQAELADFIANDVETIVDQRVAIALASWFSGSVSIGGNLFVNGTVTAPGARSTPLSSAPNRVTAWLAGDGRLGHTS